MASLPGNLVTPVADRRRSTSPLPTSFRLDSPSIRSEVCRSLSHVWKCCCRQLLTIARTSLCQRLHPARPAHLYLRWFVVKRD